MSEQDRFEDLRRRVRLDPASIAFAQLAEEYRRAGRDEEAVELCLSGLVRHPAYMSARVTLGRALLHLGRLDEAQQEFQRVLEGAPQNLTAIRGLADVHHTRGAFNDALVLYKAALALAPNDPELERIVDDLATQLAPRVDVPDHQHARAQLAALQQWLLALHVTRAKRNA